MKIVSCTHDRHALQILEVFNDAILTSTALFDYETRDPESMVAWFRGKEKGRFPVVGLESDDGMLLGFATYGTFRAWAAYKYTVEHSVYIHKEHRGKGLGRILMESLIEFARQQNYHVLVGGIEATNLRSIALHESLNFKCAGTILQAAYKFGRWLDLCFYQLILETPSNPRDA